MRLFDVPAGRRVRVTSKRVRYADTDDEGRLTVKTLSRNTTWTGTTTSHYWTFEGVKRRLIVEHTIDHFAAGIWQRDVECWVVG